MHSFHNKLLIISALSFILPIFISAQTGTLKGVIKDASDGEPLINATVQADENGTVTDLDGLFELQLTAGTHTVEVRYVGYQSFSQNVTITAGEVQELNLSLELETNVLQTATVTSGKFEKPLGEVTVSLEVLKPGLIESANATSVDDVLGKIPGVTMVDGQANIRGGSGWSYGAGSRVLLLVDDIPALQADAGFPNWDDIAVENIEQVEVVKGAASALYGSSALNGIINVRTAYAKSKPVTKVSFFKTTYLAPKDRAKKWWTIAPRERGYSLAHRQKFGKLDLVFSGYYFDQRSYNQETSLEYGRTSLGLRYRVNDRLSVGFNSNLNFGKSSSFFLWRDWEDGAYQASENANGLNVNNRFRYFIDPFVTYFDNSGNRHKFLGRIYNIDNNSIEGRSNKSNLYYTEYQFQRQMKNTGLVLTAGAVAINTFIDAELYGDTTYTSRNLAGYVQLEKKFFDKLNISVGARYENNTTKSPEFIEIGDFSRDTIPNGKITEGKPVFRIGANYELTKATYLRASWGEGYRYPTIAEQFIFTDVGFLVLPNPQLTSETGWTAEFGIKQGVAFSDWQGFVDVAAFGQSIKI